MIKKTATNNQTRKRFICCRLVHPLLRKLAGIDQTSGVVFAIIVASSKAHGSKAGGKQHKPNTKAG
ncbi:hypothetical protein KSZ_69030 [Dictyobacter formicarum]|uniref:Uncharacterized protein n=1 Tax=Dictyobacter formicarum TaxID=2778368 RepID=A0ABQ3VSP4_9CHLR|nr:hypothetical protein KSZ_69030 [Dictyobacter formicarum]